MRNALSIRSVLFTFVLLAFLMLAVPAVSSAAIVFSIEIAPPPLPVYAQPVCPGPGYIWEPGYWAYDDGYFWVPGTWVLIPEPSLLWTPGYWGWNGSLFVFYQGYWGAYVGYYGGINYGFGYTGVGYQGGYWNHGTFFYNRSVNNVGNLRNVYTKTVAVRNANHVSFNGPGGITARPTAAEQAAARDRHIPPTGVQMAHVQAASRNRQLYESANHGKPAVAATAKPAQFSGRGIVAARAAAPSYKPPAARHADRVQVSRTAPGNRAPNRTAGPRSSPRTSRAVTPQNPRPQREANVRAAPAPHEARPAAHAAALPPHIEPHHTNPTLHAHANPPPHEARSAAHAAAPSPHIEPHHTNPTLHAHANPPPHEARPAAHAATPSPHIEPHHTNPTLHAHANPPPHAPAPHEAPPKETKPPEHQ